MNRMKSGFGFSAGLRKERDREGEESDRDGVFRCNSASGSRDQKNGRVRVEKLAREPYVQGQRRETPHSTCSEGVTATTTTTPIGIDCIKKKSSYRS